MVLNEFGDCMTIASLTPRPRGGKSSKIIASWTMNGAPGDNQLPHCGLYIDPSPSGSETAIAARTALGGRRRSRLGPIPRRLAHSGSLGDRLSACRVPTNLSTSCNASRAFSAPWKAATAGARMRFPKTPFTRSSYRRPHEQQEPGRSGQAIRPQCKTATGDMEAAAAAPGCWAAECRRVGATRLPGPRDVRGSTITASSGQPGCFANGRLQRWFHAGSRLLRNACIPSFWSAVAKLA